MEEVSVEAKEATPNLSWTVNNDVMCETLGWASLIKKKDSPSFTLWMIVFKSLERLKTHFGS